MTKEEQTAGLVPALKAKYWGWFDMVNGTFLAENGRPIAMSMPQGVEHGAEVERWTAWEFPDGNVRAVRPQMLAIFDIEVDFPEHLACGCFAHDGGMDWYLIRETDFAQANISRSIEDILNPDSRAIH